MFGNYLHPSSEGFAMRLLTGNPCRVDMATVTKESETRQTVLGLELETLARELWETYLVLCTVQ